MHMFPSAPKDVSGWLGPVPDSRISAGFPSWLTEPIKVDARLLEPKVREPVSGFAVVLCRPDGTFDAAIARCNELKGGRDMWDAVSVRTTDAPVF